MNFCFFLRFFKTIIWIGLLIVESSAYPLNAIKEVRQGGEYSPLNKGKCQFPFDDPTLAVVNSNGENSGWAMSRHVCTPGSYCAYLCKSGYVASSDSDAGLNSDFFGGKVYCDLSGNIQSSSKPLCVPGKDNIYVYNLFQESVWFCQTVSSNSDLQLASNVVYGRSFSTITIPGPSYNTRSSRFYFNPPGTGNNGGCQLGSSVGNQGLWSPYILDVSTDYMGESYLKLGWNPLYVNDRYWGKIPPNWGLRVDCEGFDCTSLPCFIDPSKHSVNQCENSANGYGGSSFCVVKVSGRSKIKLVLFSKDNINNERELYNKFPFGVLGKPTHIENGLEKDVDGGRPKVYNAPSEPNSNVGPENSKKSDTPGDSPSSKHEGTNDSEHSKHDSSLPDGLSIDKLNVSDDIQGPGVDVHEGNGGFGVSRLQSPKVDDKKKSLMDSLSKLDLDSINVIGQSGDKLSKHDSKDGVTVMLFQLDDKQNSLHDSSCSLEDTSRISSVTADLSVSPGSFSDCDSTYAFLFINKKISDGYKLLANRFDNYATKISSLMQNGEFQTLELSIPETPSVSSASSASLNNTNSTHSHESSASTIINNVFWTLIIAVGVTMFL